MPGIDGLARMCTQYSLGQHSSGTCGDSTRGQQLSGVPALVEHVRGDNCQVYEWVLL